MGGEEQVNPLTLATALCVVFTLLNLGLIYPEVQARSDCANECNAKLQTLYDACVIQNGHAPDIGNLVLGGNLSGANYPFPMCMRELPNGTLVEEVCP